MTGTVWPWLLGLPNWQATALVSLVILAWCELCYTTQPRWWITLMGSLVISCMATAAGVTDWTVIMFACALSFITIRGTGPIVGGG